MAQQFSGLRIGHRKILLRVAIFPQLPAVVKQTPGQQKITVQPRICLADGRGRAHHPRYVLHQSATAGVMVGAGGGGALEAFPELLNEFNAQGAYARIIHALDEHANFLQISFLLFLQGSGTGQKAFLFLFVQQPHVQVGNLHAEPSLGPLAAQAHETAEGQGSKRPEPGFILPHLQSHGPFRIGKRHIQIRFVALGHLLRALGDLGKNFRFNLAFRGQLAQLHETDLFHACHLAPLPSIRQENAGGLR